MNRKIEFARLKYKSILIPVLVILLVLYFSISISAYYSAFYSYMSVGSGSAEFSVGTDKAILFVGDYIISLATSPISDYYGAQILLLVLPGLLLLSFIIWFFYLGYKEVKQNELIKGLTYFTLSFVLIGLILIIAMPLIISGVESTIWFK